VEDNVRAVDVSPTNDWSEVRVWFDPVKNLARAGRWTASSTTAPRRMANCANTRQGWMSDPIGEIIAAFSRR
jgi:hypothetical protein